MRTCIHDKVCVQEAGALVHCPNFKRDSTAAADGLFMRLILRMLSAPAIRRHMERLGSLALLLSLLLLTTFIFCSACMRPPPPRQFVHVRVRGVATLIRAGPDNLKVLLSRARHLA